MSALYSMMSSVTNSFIYSLQYLMSGLATLVSLGLKSSSLRIRRRRARFLIYDSLSLGDC